MHYILLISILTCLILKINCTINVCVPLSTTIYEEKFSDEQLYEELGNDIRNTLFTNGTMYVDHLDIDFVHPAMRINGTMDDLTISNLDDYTLCLLILRATEMDLFNFTLTNFTIVGKYDITGNIGDLFDIFGSGDFWMTWTNFSIAMTHFNMQTNDEEMCFTLNIDVTIGAVHNYFDNFMGDPELCDLMNEVMQAIIPESVEIIWGEFKDQIDAPLEKMINDWLHRKHIREFLQKKLLSNNQGLFNYCIDG